MCFKQISSIGQIFEGFPVEHIGQISWWGNVHALVFPIELLVYYYDLNSSWSKWQVNLLFFFLINLPTAMQMWQTDGSRIFGRFLI